MKKTNFKIEEDSKRRHKMSSASKDAFSTESPVKTVKEATEIADRRPVLVFVYRRKYQGEFIVDIFVYTQIYLKSGASVGKKITDKLIGNKKSGYAYSKREIFKTYKASEKWIINSLKEIRNNRIKFIGRKQKDTSLEYILIE